MELTPFLTSEKGVRQLLGETGLRFFLWDPEWTEFVAFRPKTSDMTPQNIRGALKRTARAKQYAIEILEPEFSMPSDPEPTGVTFRIRKLDVTELPPQKKVERRRYDPADVEDYVQAELF